MLSSPPSLAYTTCGSLLQELQKLWDEIGENDRERDKMLLQLEQECLDIYRKKVEKSRKYKTDLHHMLRDAEAEFASIVAALGEQASFSWEKGTLKEQLAAVKPVLEDLRLKKQERLQEFLETESQIELICAEIAGKSQFNYSTDVAVNERDLTAKKYGELNLHLRELQNEKNLRLQTVNSHINTIHELSVIMSVDFNKTMVEIHPSLGDHATTQSKNISISNDTLSGLVGAIQSLKQEKQQRLQKLQDIGSTFIELWNLMDTPLDEQKKFSHVTCLISASVDDLSRSGCLALDVIEQAKIEVERLNALKASKMRELVLKKEKQLEEIYTGVHIDVDSETEQQTLISLIESGNVDLCCLLSSMDDKIACAKEQASSRKDILDRVDKWKHASEEEKWLDEYERDDNRYIAGRGAHKNLKRAEKARAIVGKIPSLVENLAAKVHAWEIEKGIPFLYEKVSLLQSLQEYTVQRHEREEEKRRSREQKRLQEQFATEQEALFGSKPTIKKPLGQSTAANTTVGTPTARYSVTPLARHGASAAKERRDSSKNNVMIPINYVALSKDDPVSRGN